MNKCNSSVTWSASFSEFSGAPFCTSLCKSWSVTLGAIAGVLSGAPKLYYQAHLKCIHRCSVCTLLCITRCSKKFLTGQILHPFAPINPLVRAFSSVLYILSYLQSQLHLELFLSFLCSSEQIIDYTLKYAIIYTNVCIIYSAGIALYTCVK